MPTRAISVRRTGSWKAMPKARIMCMTSDRYSLTFASSWIGTVAESPGVSKLMKKDQAIGKMK